ATVADVLDARVGGQLLAERGRSVEARREAVERAGRHDALHLLVAERQAEVGAVTRAGRADVVRDGQTLLEEVANVVRVRDPGYRLTVAEPLRDVQPGVELRTPALVHAVVRAGVETVDELELALRALAVGVLVVGELGDLVEGDVAARRRLEAARGIAARLRGD